VKEIEDYIVAYDSSQKDILSEWTVIVKDKYWKDIVVKFRDIVVTNENHTLKFVLDVLHVPENSELLEKDFERFHRHCGLILADIMVDLDSRDAIILRKKETGETL